MTEDEFWIQPENSALGRWQKAISDVAKVDTFCALPWIHFATRPNGDMRLCCSANASGAGNDHTVGLVKNEKGQPANFGRETPMSAWNNDYMRSVRTTMLEGKIPKSCTKCFVEESNGVSSKRVWETFSWMQEGIDIPELIKHHNTHNKIATVTAVQPAGRFGGLEIENSTSVKSFAEKKRNDSSWINGGFFVCNPEIFSYIDNDQTIFESNTLEKLASENQLTSYKHYGFWECMDTLKEKNNLNNLWNNNQSTWKIW